MQRSWMLATLVATTLVVIVTAENGDFEFNNYIPKECPKVDPVNKTIHLAHEWDCTKFYKCNNGKRILFECPTIDDKGTKLHFDPVLQVCSRPEDAGCIPGGGPPTNTPPTTTGSTNTPSKPTETTFVPTDDVDQNSTPTPSGNLVPHENNCSKFYEIVKGMKILKECPRGLHFSPTNKICMPPLEAGCNSTPTTPTITAPTTTIQTTTPGLCEKDCGGIGNGWVVAHECVCSKYYLCYNGDLILKQCPEGLHFGKTFYGCVAPELAGCESSTESTVTTVITTVEIPTECPPDNSEPPVQLPHPTNCSLYYMCDNGKKILQECPKDLHFNPVLQMCDWANTAGCQTSTTPSWSTPTPSNSITHETTGLPDSTIHVTTTHPLCSPGSKVPHKTNCSLFYECENGKHVIKECTDGFHFNPVLNICDWWQSAGCTATTYPPISSSTSSTSTVPASTTTKSSQPPACIGTCPKTDPSEYTVMLPNADCTKFCKCSNGRAYQMDCPPGLHFSPTIFVCAHPKDAKCKGGGYEQSDNEVSMASD